MGKGTRPRRTWSWGEERIQFWVERLGLLRKKEAVMPPHCDAMDGPVVKAAMKALDAEDASLILPFVPKAGEAEIAKAFEKVIRMRKQGPEAKEVADLYFFETVVRIHRAGEGAPYTGLKPAGLGHGPVVPVAERAIETGSPEELLKLLFDTVRAEVKAKFDRVMHLKSHAEGNVDEAREYVEAMLGLEVYSHKLYTCAKAGLHGAGHQHGD